MEKYPIIFFVSPHSLSLCPVSLISKCEDDQKGRLRQPKHGVQAGAKEKHQGQGMRCPTLSQTRMLGQ